jgi:hypothetical protein
MENKYKSKIMYLEGLETVTKTVSIRKKRAGQSVPNSTNTAPYLQMDMFHFYWHGFY